MDDFIDLRRIVRVVFRWWWLLVVSTIISAVLGYWVSQRQTPIYEATATILVGQILQANNIDRQEILTSELIAQTYSDLTRRQPVLQAAIDALELDLTWQQLKKQVSVELVTGTQLIQITVEAYSPASAQIIADEISAQMIQFKSADGDSTEIKTAKVFVQQQIGNLQQRIESGQSKLAALKLEMATEQSTERLNELQAEVSTLESLMVNWENTHVQLLGYLQTGQSPNSMTIIEPAQSNPKPVSPQVQLIVILAALLGSILALGAIFLLEYLDDTYKTSEDISHGLGLPVLGNISAVAKPKGHSVGIYTSKFPHSPFAETFRLLRANLELIGSNQPLKSVLITSCDKGAGKSTISTNLAIIMAYNDRETILMDADLRNSSIHKMTALSNDHGLSDILRNSTDIPKVLQRYDDLKCGVITGGSFQPNPSELLGSKKMDWVLTELKRISDIVIVDSPPLFTSEALLLSVKVDGVLLVIRLGQTQKKMIKAKLDQLRRSGANVIGVILNGTPEKTSEANYVYQYTKNHEKLATGQKPKVPDLWSLVSRGLNLEQFLGTNGKSKSQKKNEIGLPRINHPKSFLTQAIMNKKQQEAEFDKSYLENIAHKRRQNSLKGSGYLPENLDDDISLETLEALDRFTAPDRSETKKTNAYKQKTAKASKNSKGRSSKSGSNEKKPLLVAKTGSNCPNENCPDYGKLYDLTNNNIIKYGILKTGAQRYRCKTCGKLFSKPVIVKALSK